MAPVFTQQNARRIQNVHVVERRSHHCARDLKHRVKGRAAAITCYEPHAGLRCLPENSVTRRDIRRIRLIKATVLPDREIECSPVLIMRGPDKQRSNLTQFLYLGRLRDLALLHNAPSTLAPVRCSTSTSVAPWWGAQRQLYRLYKQATRKFFCSFATEARTKVHMRFEDASHLKDANGSA